MTGSEWRGRDGSWGRKPRDPFLRWMMRTPERAARIHMLFTVGMMLFWIFLFAGVVLAVYFIFWGG